MNNKKITVSIEVLANIEKVWDYWTSPEHIVNWCFASDDWCCPASENDLKIDGKFCSKMSAKDGSYSFDFGGMYTGIEHLKYIKYVMASMIYKEGNMEYDLESGREVEVIFETNGDKTIITEIFDKEDIHSDEQQKEGWQAILGNFKKYVENN